MGVPHGNTAPRLSNAGSVDASGGNTVDLQQVLRLLRTDPEFRRELKDVIMEFMEPEVQRLRDEMQQMAAEANSSGGSSAAKPPLSGSKEGIIAKEFPGSEASLWTHQDAQGQVYGFPETIEVDLIKHNNMSYLCNVRDVRSPRIVYIPSSLWFLFCFVCFVLGCTVSPILMSRRLIICSPTYLATHS
jgi:hypothetical protein